MTAEFGFDAQPPLEPRLSDTPLKDPFSPNAYFWVGFFVGFLPMAYLALANAKRLSRDPALATRTLGAAVVVVLVGLVAFVIAPVTWVDTNSNVRLMVRILGAIGSVGLNLLHRGPALTRSLSSGETTSAWKKFIPIVVLAIAQAGIVFTIVSARGLR